MRNYALMLAGGALLLAVPQMNQARDTLADGGDLRQAASAATRVHAERLLELDNQQAMAEIAEERYRTGCLPVVDPRQEYWVSLIDGSPVIDPIMNSPVPAGTVVCDGRGNTALIVPEQQADGTWLPVARSFAFTGNQDVVRERLSQFPQFRETQPSQSFRPQPEPQPEFQPANFEEVNHDI